MLQTRNYYGVMTQTRWWKYVTNLIGDSSYSAAANKAGFDKSAFTRWKKGAKADPEFVIKLARAYNTNVLQALVEAEFITAKEAKLNLVDTGGTKLAEATDDELADEVLRRMKLGVERDGPLDTPIDELAQRRHVTPDPYDDDDTMPEDAAAYGGPDEDKLKEERGEYGFDT